MNHNIELELNINNEKNKVYICFNENLYTFI